MEKEPETLLEKLNIPHVDFGSPALREILQVFKEEEEELSRQAEERGLKRFSPQSHKAFVGSDYKPGDIPMHFYVRHYPEPGSKPELKEYSLQFPISNYPELLEFIKGLGELYRAAEEPIAILSHDPRGFVKYLEKLQNDLTS